MLPASGSGSSVNKWKMSPLFEKVESGVLKKAGVTIQLWKVAKTTRTVNMSNLPSLLSLSTFLFIGFVVFPSDQLFFSDRLFEVEMTFFSFFRKIFISFFLIKTLALIIITTKICCI